MLYKCFVYKKNEKEYEILHHESRFLNEMKRDIRSAMNV